MQRSLYIPLHKIIFAIMAEHIVSFDFESAAEAQSAFFSIISGKKNILDYLNKYSSETIRKEDFLKALKKEIKPGA